jgi:DNA-directed RNA polymerase specialized sigma24 family protein
MNSPALQMARLALAALPPGERAALLAESTAPAPERIITRAEVAERFRKSVRAVDQWAKRGMLRKVRLPGSSRAVGFCLSEVENLLRGTEG